MLRYSCRMSMNRCTVIPRVGAGLDSAVLPAVNKDYFNHHCKNRRKKYTKKILAKRFTQPAAIRISVRTTRNLVVSVGLSKWLNYLNTYNYSTICLKFSMSMSVGWGWGWGRRWWVRGMWGWGQHGNGNGVGMEIILRERGRDGVNLFSATVV